MFTSPDVVVMLLYAPAFASTVLWAIATRADMPTPTAPAAPTLPTMPKSLKSSDEVMSTDDALICEYCPVFAMVTASRNKIAALKGTLTAPEPAAPAATNKMFSDADADI